MGKSNNVVIAGGGTGGHIYPGLALAARLKVTNPSCKVHFVGARGGLEEKIIPAHKYPLHLLRVERMHRSVGLLRRIKALLLLPLSFTYSIYLFLRLRPRWVLGVGGFASGPFVFISSLLGGKVALLEPNAFPGMANRYLSKVVRYCFLVFPETAKYFPKSKVRTVGLPVRFEKVDSKQKYTGDRKLRVLVFGGSQGARAINEVVGSWVESLGRQSESLEILQQVGHRDYQVWEKRYQNKFESFLDYRAYIDDMPEKLAWADFVICRAGVGTLAEVAMSQSPALFVPLPTAADNHQHKNAESLVQKNAALLCIQDEFNVAYLEKTIASFLDNPSLLAEISQNLESIDYSKATDHILEILEGDLQ